MLNAFLVALAVFICVGGAELVGFTMLNRPIVIGPLVGLFLGDLHTGVIIGASLEAVFMGVVNIGGASAAEPGIATAVGTAFAIMLGKGSEVALTLATSIRYPLLLHDQDRSLHFYCRYVCKNLRPSGGRRKRKTDCCSSLWALDCKLVFIFPVRIFRDPVRI